MLPYFFFFFIINCIVFKEPHFLSYDINEYNQKVILQNVTPKFYYILPNSHLVTHAMQNVTQQIFGWAISLPNVAIVNKFGLFPNEATIFLNHPICLLIPNFFSC